MAQFDVYLNKSLKSKKEIPFLLDIQSDLLSALNSRIVVPLINKNFIKPIKYLNPILMVENNAVIMSTAELASTPISSLDQKIISIKEQRNEIVSALDFLITGF